MNLKNWLEKSFVAFLVAAMSLGVSACALQPEPLPSPPPTVLPTVLPSPTALSMDALDPSGAELHLWHALTGVKEATLLNLVAGFEASNPEGIKLRVEFHRPLHQEVRTAIAAGTPPDIVITSCDRVAEYAELDAIALLAPYLDSAKHGLEAEQADLWPFALSGCSGVQPRDSLGLLFDTQAAVMFYNATWLKKLKVEAPPQTWDEFRKLANVARDKKTATWGYAHANDGLRLVNWISGVGGVLFDVRDSQVTLDDSQAAAALGVLQDLLQDDCAYCVTEAGADRAVFAAEKVLFNFGSTADLSQYTAAIYNATTEKAKFAWDIAPMPGLRSQPVVTVQGSVMSILRTTPRQQLAAWLFLKWFVQRENDVQWALATGALPLHKSSIDTPAMQAYLEQNPHFKTACGLLAHAETEPVVPGWQEVRALLVDAAEMVCSGQAEPADALAAADTAADALVAR